MQQILSLLMSSFGDRVGDTVSRHAKTAVFVLVAGVFLFAAFVMGVGALTVWLSQHIDLWAALAIVALGLLGIGGIILGFGALRMMSAENEKKLEETTLKRDAMLGALSALGTRGGASTGKALAVAALVGLLAGTLLLGDGKPDDDQD